MGQDVVSPKAAAGRSGRGEQTSQGRGAPPSATESGRRPFVQLQTGPAGWGAGPAAGPPLPEERRHPEQGLGGCEKRDDGWERSLHGG